MKPAAEPVKHLPPLSTEGVAVRFDGRGADYFRIWIGDVLAMMLTLGLYWPWMRRRRWQYLDGCTWLGPRPLGNPAHASQPGAWPTWQQQLLVGLLLAGLWFLTRRYGIFGWPRLLLLFSLTGPWWLDRAWHGRVAHWQIEGVAPRFTGHLLLAAGVWLLMCLLLVPAGLLLGALFLDNIRIWLLGASWSARIGISEGMRHALPWLAGSGVALALAGWHFCSNRFGLGHLAHPAGDGRCRMRFWPVWRAALIATVLVLPAPFLAIGLIYANWPVLLSTLSIEPPATLENLANLAPDGESLLGSLRLDGTQPDGSPLVGAGVCVLCRAGVVALLVLLCGLVMMMGWRYFMVRFWNYRLATFTIAGHAFESHLPAGRVMATGFVCDLLTVLTLGLHHPFGVVRMARLYRESVRVLPQPAAAGAPWAAALPLAVTTGGGGRPGTLGTAGIIGAAATATATGTATGTCTTCTTATAATASATTTAGMDHPVLPRPWLPWPRALLLVLLPGVLGVLASVYAKPMVGMMLVRNLPPALRAEVGASALRALQRAGAGPSALSEESRQRLRDSLGAAARRTWPPASLPPWQLHILHGGEVLGPNALALPGNIIVITDELLALAASRPDREAVLLGVFGHELARLVAHHPEQALVTHSLRKALWLALTGRGREDLVASGADTVLNLGYNADMEREADLGARRMMLANGQDPAAMADFLRELARLRADDPAWAAAAQRVAAGMASQPVDAPRLRLFGGGAGEQKPALPEGRGDERGEGGG